MTTGSRQSAIAGYVVFAITLLFLFYEFFLRVFPSIMVPELMKAFSVDALSLGTLSAFYFYSYAPMQLPVGILLDRYGARRLLTIASVICAMGCFFFAYTQTLFLAELGRFLMGIGSAFAFVGMVYVVSHWFSEDKRALLIGVGNSIGLLGSAGGEGPLSIFVAQFGWRETILILGFAGIVIAILCFFALRQTMQYSTQACKEQDSLASSLSGFQNVCMNSRGWFNSVGALLFYLTTGTFAGLWAVPFLQTVHGLSEEYAAFCVTVFFIGSIFGGPILGLLSDWMSSRKPILYFTTIPAALVFLPLILVPFLPVWVIFVIFFTLGFLCAAQLLNFTLAVEMNSLRVKGSAIAKTNFVIAIGGSIMQPTVGWLLDLSAGAKASASASTYTITDYQTAMIVFPVAFILAAICFIPVKEVQG